jgi:tRNA-binding protein
VSEASGVVTVEEFGRLDIRVGRVVEALPFPEGRYLTHVLLIDFGPGLGTRKSLAKLAPNYSGGEDVRVDRLGEVVLQRPGGDLGD